MSLIDLITGAIGNQAAENTSSKLGVDKSQWASLAAVAAPLIIGALRDNAQQSPAQAEAINNALARDHDGSILSNPAGANEAEGNSILGHIFGSNKGQIEEQLSSKTGIDLGKIGPMLATLAPIVMGYIGQQRSKSNVNSGGGITDLLGNILSDTASSGKGTQAGGFDLGDIASAVLGGSNNSSNSALGNILGSLFK